ncbi:CcmD family protein [Methanolobus sp. WCC5]
MSALEIAFAITWITLSVYILYLLRSRMVPMRRFHKQGKKMS